MDIVGKTGVVGLSGEGSAVVKSGLLRMKVSSFWAPSRFGLVGLSTVAFCLAASIFAMFLYLTLYIQDDLGYGPLAAGVRFLPMTLLIFFTSFFAGRLTVRIHSRLLLGIGMLFVTGGLLLMGTTHPDSTWTVLLPGFLVSGFGVGIVNPVLASGAVSTDLCHQPSSERVIACTSPSTSRRTSAGSGAQTRNSLMVALQQDDGQVREQFGG